MNALISSAKKWITNILETVNLTHNEAKTKTVVKECKKSANIQKCRSLVVVKSQTINLMPKPAQRTWLGRG